ncbi:MAG: aminotransferase class V-fold PLP-dependent enzyme [Longimicrobiales bacterium]
MADLTLRRNRAFGFEESELGDIQRRARHAVAALLRVEARDVALVPNTSFGVNLAAHLVAHRCAPGRIVVSAGEFPANVLPWKVLERRGFDVHLTPTDEDGSPREDALLAALDAPGVRALAVSAVQFVTGYRADLATLGAACRERGILFCIDAIQAVGAVPFHPTEVHADVVACGGQKWLCSPWGSGFLWMRPELRDGFAPPMVSWLATEDGADFDDLLHYRMDWRDDARRYELATNGIQDYLGLARSAEVFLEIGLDRIERHLADVLAPLRDWITARDGARCITPADPAHCAGILSFRSAGVGAFAEALHAAGVVVSVREGALRFAPHVYTTRAQVEQVIRILDGTPGD